MRSCDADQVLPPSTAMLLHTEHLTKDYGRFRALDDLNLAVAAGEVFGLLGPNGSGKIDGPAAAARLPAADRRPGRRSPATIAGATASPPAARSPTCPANCGSTRT